MAKTDPQPETTTEPAALLAEFDSVDTLKSAAQAIRDEGFRRWDAHSPYPVHGLDRAMGIRPTVLPWLVLGAGLTGCAVALLLQWGTNAVAYPFIISGKPFFSLPANIPITFELIVLFSALAAFGGVMVLNRLPEFAHPVFRSPRFRRATTDGFFISIDAADPRFDVERTKALLESLGAAAVEVCYQPAQGRTPPKALWGIVAVVAVLALLPPLGLAWYREAPKRKPRIHPLLDMVAQPKFKPQTLNPLFPDHRAMRPQPAGTIALGQLHADRAFYQGKDEQGNWVERAPIAVNMETMLRGQERFGIYCAPCHGYAGGAPEGIAADDMSKWEGMVSLRAQERSDNWLPPRALHSGYVQDQPDGQLFGTITHGVVKAGVQTMPSYGVQIPEADRWAIVLYLRALGRSRNASLDDLPEDKKALFQE